MGDGSGYTLDEMPARTLRVLSPVDCDIATPRRYLIKGLVAEGDHVELVGQPAAGKSVLAPHLAYAVAQGRSVFGLRVRHGPVLYVAAEDGHGMTARIRALRDRWGDAPDFHLVPDAVDLLNGEADLRLLEALTEACRPALIVIDTLARAFPGLAENEAEGMSRVVRIVRSLAAISNAAVVMVHHVAKDGGETPRGHGSLNADADAVLVVSGSGSEPRAVRLGKNRNGASDQTFTFGLHVRLLGEDEDGDPITAPIADEILVTAAATNSKAREAKLRDKPAMMLRELRAAARQAEPLEPEPGMPIVLGFTRQNFRQILIERGWFPENMLLVALNSTTLARSGYAPENNSLTALKKAGFLNFSSRFVWLL